MVGKGTVAGSHHPTRCHRTTCMVKAELLEAQPQWPQSRTLAKDGWNASPGGSAVCFGYRTIQPSWHTSLYEGERGERATYSMPFAHPAVNAGSPTQVRGARTRTCRATEPPYYSPCVCNGLRSSRTRVLRETDMDTSGRQRLRRPHCLGGREAAFSEPNKPNTRLC